MYKIRYYLTGGTLTSKTFNTLHETTMFAVFKITCENVYTIDKI
jgi:hypothetical protein